MSISRICKTVVATLFVFSFLTMTGTAARANLAQVKLYKTTFEGEKPKCTTCHMDKAPKKEEGKHEWNDYGKKILAAKKELNKEQVDEEVLKKVGKNEAADQE
jgi:hypothetical protein